MDGQSDRRTGGLSNQTDFTGVQLRRCGASDSSQTCSHSWDPGPISLSWGHAPFLDILAAKPWPEMGISSTPHSDSAEPTGLNKGPSPFLKTTLGMTSCSSSFQPLSNAFCMRPQGLLRVTGPLDMPGPGLRQETEKLLHELICLFTALHPPGSKSV